MRRDRADFDEISGGGHLRDFGPAYLACCSLEEQQPIVESLRDSSASSAGGWGNPATFMTMNILFCAGSD
jgi:hypothetical protein